MSTQQSGVSGTGENSAESLISPAVDHGTDPSLLEWLLERLVHIEDLDEGYALSFFGADDLHRLQSTIEAFVAAETRHCPLLALDWEVCFDKGIRLTMTGRDSAKRFVRDNILLRVGKPADAEERVP